MTLNVSLEEVPFAILEAVKARILAQRRRLTEQKSSRPLGKRPPYQRSGAVSNVFRRDEPAGTDVRSPLLHLKIKVSEVSNIYQPLTTYGIVVTGRFTVRNYAGRYYISVFGAPSSAEATKELSISLQTSGQAAPIVHNVVTGNPGSFPTYGNDSYGARVNYLNINQPRSSVIVLPAGGKTAIVISAISVFWLTVNLQFGGSVIPPNKYANFVTPQRIFSPFQSLLTQSDYKVSVRAYICNEYGMRPIAVPATMKAIMDKLFPPGATKQFTVDERLLDQYPFAVSSTYYGPSTEPVYLGSPTDAGISLNGYTPSIFARLQEVQAFTAPNQIKGFPADKRWIMPDTSRGWWNSDLSNADRTAAYYQRWPVFNQAPNYSSNTFVPIAADQYTFVDQAEPRFFSYESPSDLQNIHVVWDWDDPEYCQFMCKELGFSDADLKP